MVIFSKKTRLKWKKRKMDTTQACYAFRPAKGSSARRLLVENIFFCKKKLIEQHKKNTRKTLIETTQAPSVDKNVMCALLMKLVNH